MATETDIVLRARFEDDATPGLEGLERTVAATGQAATNASNAQQALTGMNQAMREAPVAEFAGNMQAIKGTLAEAFSGALAGQITAVFKALGAGEKVSLKKALGAILQAVGSAAIALGTFAILAGALSFPMFAPLTGGPAATAMGVALVAFGAGLTAAGAALAKSGKKRGGGSTSAQQPSGGGRTIGVGGGQAQSLPAVTLNVQALDPAAVDWDDLAENRIGPALERVVGRGASKMVVQPG